MKKIFSALLISLAAIAANAGSPSQALFNASDNLQMQCPVDIMPGWVVQAVSADQNATTVTIVIDDPTVMNGDTDTLKTKLGRQIASLPYKTGSLIYETVASDLPLVADLISAAGDKTVTLTFTPQEINALRSK